VCDANHFLYLVKANQLFLTGHGNSVEEGLRAIEAPLLLIGSADDLVFPPGRHMRALAGELAAMGKDVAYTEVITTDLGHLDGIAHIAKAGADIARSLAAGLA
jgi:homoserine O-acetyltransferase